jgi:hypothetical protein
MTRLIDWLVRWLEETKFRIASEGLWVQSSRLGGRYGSIRKGQNSLLITLDMVLKNFICFERAGHIAGEQRR